MRSAADLPVCLLESPVATLFAGFFDGCAFLSEFSTMPSVMVQLKVNARLQHILSRQSCNLLGYSGSNALGMALFSKTIRWA